MEGLTLDEEIGCYRPDGDDGKPLRNDRYRSMIAICAVMLFGQFGRPSLNARLVEEGLAIAYRRYSTMFERQEGWAKRERPGIWRGPSDPPEAWRRRKSRSRP